MRRAVYCLIMGVIPLAAQTPSPADAKTVIKNGGFESTRSAEDLWDGGDASGFLAGLRNQLPILTENGDVAASAMPVSVAVGDLNADGLTDLVMMDVVGYLRVYFNQGTKTEPKFGANEIAPIFLTRAPRAMVPDLFAAFYVRQGPRICLVDSDRSGKFDIYVGNYWGEVYYIRNTGTAAKPDYRQPADLKKLLVATSKNPEALWGNLFAPAAWDWNGDGKYDLLLGEGSYSANNIHLLINQATSANPAFDETNRTVLAYGDGREQLTPAVVDYNGDGRMDLLVAERTGTLALHLNPGGAWKPGVEIPFASLVAGANGKPLAFGGIFTVATGDLNGDGLFDIIAGKANGRVTVAYYAGTKIEPKFAPPVEIKGDAPTPPLKVPNGWDIDMGLDRGNFYGYAEVVTSETDPEAAPPEGKACLKIGYQRGANQFLSAPVAGSYSPEYPGFSRTDPLLGQHLNKSQLVLQDAAANVGLLRLPNLPFKTKTKYTLSFRVKGTSVSAAHLAVGWQAVLALSESKVTQLDRGVKVEENKVQERGQAISDFAVGGQWAEVKLNFDTTFREKRLNVDELPSMRGVMEITFALQPMIGKIYIDDVRLTSK